jgi:drug/metabolite transporter (DMT)-like permease
MASPQIDRASWIMLLCLSLLWSASFLFMKVAAESLPILTLVLIRVGVAAAVLQVAVALRRSPRPKGAPILLRYALIGIFNNLLPGALIVYATIRIGAGAASILNATAPIFTLLIAHFATTDEKMTVPKLVGITLGFLGVVAMSAPGAMGGVGSEQLAILAMLAATFCYGLSAMIGRSFGGIPPLVSAAYQLTAATLMLAPIVLLVEPPWTLDAPSAEAIAAALALALLSTALAYVLFFAVIARSGATNVMLVTLMIPVSGVILAWLFLGEALELDEALGMALIGFGLVVIDGRTLAAMRRQPA